MDMDAELQGQQVWYLRDHCCAGIVRNQMDADGLGCELLDLPKEGQELLVPMARLALDDHLCFRQIKYNERSYVAVVGVMVRDALARAQARGEQRLGPIHFLDLLLGVDS